MTPAIDRRHYRLDGKAKRGIPTEERARCHAAYLSQMWRADIRHYWCERCQRWHCGNYHQKED